MLAIGLSHGCSESIELLLRSAQEVPTSGFNNTLKNIWQTYLHGAMRTAAYVRHGLAQLPKPETTLDFHILPQFLGACKLRPDNSRMKSPAIHSPIVNRRFQNARLDAPNHDPRQQRRGIPSVPGGPRDGGSRGRAARTRKLSL